MEHSIYLQSPHNTKDTQEKLRVIKMTKGQMGLISEKCARQISSRFQGKKSPSYRKYTIQMIGKCFSGYSYSVYEIVVNKRETCDTLLYFSINLLYH